MAVIVAAELPVNAPVPATKDVELAAAATVIDNGTVRSELELESVTTAPPAGAPCDNVTVHVVEAFGPRLVELHASDETTMEAASVTVVFAEVPL